MSSDGFSLLDLIDAERDAAGPDPADIAKAVDARIPRSERAGVFLHLLTRYIVTSRPRLSQVLHSPTPPAPSSARSAKVAAYREHAQFLRLTVSVGAGETRWMRDCTYEDLIHAANLRRRKAAQTLAAAERFEALAALLQHHRAATVGALKPAVLEAFLTEAKAAA